MQIINDIVIPQWLTDPIKNIQHVSIADFFDPLKPQLDQWSSEILQRPIISTQNWLNYMLPDLTDEHTALRWHNESGYDQDAVPGTHAATIWISGDVNSGGIFQWLDREGMLYDLPFKPNTFFVIDTETIHRVTEYQGNTPRVSLTFCFEYVQIV